MTEWTEKLADRISEAFGEPTLIPDEVKAVLWDINSEAWSRGVLWSRFNGSVPPPSEPNPYRKPPLVLPTKPSVIRAQVFDAERVLYGPLTSSMDWCRAEDGFAVSPEDIRSFEVLWTEDA